MNYVISIEDGRENWFELEKNYKRHYAEMKERLDGQGMPIGDYNPRLKAYFEAFDGGWLVNYVVRLEGEPVGHANVYVTQDMHNGEMIAQEDAIYIVPEHRNGIGKKLTEFILADLAKRGCKRGYISAVTDLRAEALWRRIGFKDMAMQMVYTF